jgi:hypothetical protein
MMIDEAALRVVEAEVLQELTHDVHVPERISAERWKAIAALCREPGEQEKFFENFLDTALALALRCTACGRAFLLNRLGEASFFVADEDGDQVEMDNEPPCSP